jgi:hypothetical protein
MALLAPGRSGHFALAGAAAAGLMSTTASAFPASVPGKLPTGDIHDFDFFWIIEHRRVEEKRS